VSEFPLERAAREAAPRVLAALVRRGQAFAEAEDALQEALLAAAAEWPAAGAPTNPAGWLYRVALRRLADLRASEDARRAREAEVGAARAGPPEAPLHDGGDDDTLELLFLCCHRALTPPSAIALTLRAVGGLTTAEIASAFLVPEATMAQRISRAKAAIVASGARFGEPDEGQRAARLDDVLRVLYLVFNEGHAASHGAQLVRVELSREALRLTRALVRAAPESAEAAGLLALMLLTDARRPARIGPAGELIPLDQQERTRWDRAALLEGRARLDAPLARGTIREYPIQAAIAAVHADAAHAADTDWARILALYELLERVRPDASVALNRAIAHAMVHGPEAGLAALDALAREEPLATSPRLAAARAHLLLRAGRRAEARALFLATAEFAPTEPERAYLRAQAARLGSER